MFSRLPYFISSLVQGLGRTQNALLQGVQHSCRPLPGHSIQVHDGHDCYPWCIPGSTPFSTGGDGTRSPPSTPATLSYRIATEFFSPAHLRVPLGWEHRDRLSHASLLTGWTLVQQAPEVPGTSVFWEHRNQTSAPPKTPVFPISYGVGD